MKLKKILDMDLDFFLNKIEFGRNVFTVQRLDSKVYKPWPIRYLTKFLNKNCGLMGKKYSGKYFTHHHEVFYFLQDICSDGSKVEIDHIDGHSDLGFGDISFDYICTEILGENINDRLNKIICNNKSKYLTPGNYLAYAISMRWLDKIRFVHPLNKGNDLPRFHFKDFSISSNIIQMKYLSRQFMDTVNSYGLDDAAKSINPLAYEPEIPFESINDYDFNSDGNYDYILLTQSPGFTPIESDKLIPVFKNYFRSS